MVKAKQAKAERTGPGSSVCGIDCNPCGTVIRRTASQVYTRWACYWTSWVAAVVNMGHVDQPLPPRMDVSPRRFVKLVLDVPLRPTRSGRACSIALPCHSVSTAPPTSPASGSTHHYALLMPSKTGHQTRRKCLLAIVHFIRSQDHFSYES